MYLDMYLNVACFVCNKWAMFCPVDLDICSTYEQTPVWLLLAVAIHCIIAVLLFLLTVLIYQYVLYSLYNGQIDSGGGWNCAKDGVELEKNDEVSTKEFVSRKQDDSTQAVKTLMKNLNIDTESTEKKAIKTHAAKINTPLSSMTTRHQICSLETKIFPEHKEKESIKSYFLDLTSTDMLENVVCGRPTHEIKLRVVGYIVPVESKNSRRFQVYLANSDKYVMRLTAWNNDADNLSKRIKMHSKVHFNNLEVCKYWTAKNEVNITSSQYELHFNSPNSKVLQILALPPSELNKVNVDYPCPNIFPPYWKVFSNLLGVRDRHLSGHAVVLQSFEVYTFTPNRYSPPMRGVYGIVGDKSMVKLTMFIKAYSRETRELLRDMTQGVEFHFQNANAHLRGTTLWLLTDYIYAVAIPSESAHNMGLAQDPGDYLEWSNNGSNSEKRKAGIPDDDNDLENEPTSSTIRGLYL
ncbi:hypothetical protein Ddc_16489 [Ditylenchus destructor]|nr:hypothetical protein Ddc_16489 [Ditylenchus destructor]